MTSLVGSQAEARRVRAKVPPVPPRARWLVAVTVALLVVAVAGQVAGESASLLDLYRYENFYIGVALSAPVLGVLILRRAPDNTVGWLLVVTGTAGALAVAAASFTSLIVGSWLNQWAPWPALGLLPLPLLVFPDGRLPSSRWRFVWGVGLASVIVPAVLLAAGAVFSPWQLTVVDASLPPVARLLLSAATRVAVIGLLLTTVAAVTALVVRWRRSSGENRAQFQVLAIGGAFIVPLLVLEWQVGGGLLGVAAMVIPVAMTLAILRHGLLDLDVLVNRSLVYGVLTVVLVAAYAGLATALGAVLGDRWSWGPSLLATGLVAVAFEPVRERLQRAANRLLYGDRDDPYAVVSSLGTQLERVVDVDAVLPGIVDAVERSLQVPYVAVQLRGPEGYLTAADNGRDVPDVEPVAFPMTYQTEEVGRLLVAPRSATRPFTASETGLLRDLARQAGVAARTVRLTADLRQSRERIVRSREEERRRLRRDLHDGLGPRLSGLLMQVGAGRVALDRGTLPPALLDGVEAELRTCVGEVRQVIDDLRPPALDEAGLIEALRRQLATDPADDGDGVRVSVVVRGELPALPAAVEVAAYRIANEAVTNVHRHAGASTCEVSFAHADGDLLLEVVDDGVGYSGPRADGVGVGSMRERAEELGGDTVIESGSSGGTLVRARLPLGTTAPVAAESAAR